MPKPTTRPAEAAKRASPPALHAYATRLAALDDEQHRLRARLESLSETIAAADTAAVELEALREQHRAGRAAALLQNVPADLKSIDTEIGAAEAADRDAREQAATATTAIELAGNRLTEIETERQAVLAERDAAARVYIMAEHADAFARFGEAVSALAGPVARLTAAERVWRLFFPDSRRDPYPGRAGLADALRQAEALRVPPEFTALRDPKIAERYAPEAIQGACVAAWLDPTQAGSLGDAEAATLAATLNAAGYAITVAHHQPQEPEPWVTVTLLNCTMPMAVAGSGIPDPSCPSRAINQEMRTAGPWESLRLPQSEAARLIGLGLAAEGVVAPPARHDEAVAVGLRKSPEWANYERALTAGPGESRNAAFVRSRFNADE
ncbi:hypothetical protein [Cupriavidus metallidurans]|uniref:hypothetical protein n=1 Tax=Cupriavidus metallidurans TaxID=119219 RepID=UPI001BFBFF18|nr:hypothetical protein [Cupriavidus metallidurans]QWC87782.1 hypothetical protein KB891_12095 [Cupriavidus metallidurans]